MEIGFIMATLMLLIILFLIIRRLVGPLNILTRFFVNCGNALLILVLLNYSGSYTGLNIPINLLSVICVIVLWVPGYIFLLFLKNMWRIGRESLTVWERAQLITIIMKAAGISWNKLRDYLNQELVVLDKKGCKERYADSGLSLVELVEKARREWEQSKNLFNEANDPDLMDHAIYAMGAAEKKYIYLLKLARKEKVTDEKIYPLEDNGLV